MAAPSAHSSTSNPSSPSSPTCPEPSLADWRPTDADRRMLEAPLNLHSYTGHTTYDRGVSPVYHPNAVRGMLLDPKTTSFLELMRHNRDMRERLFKSTWYESEFLRIREDRMFIRELALCPLDVVKTVLAYFPKMHICACSAYFAYDTGRLRTQLVMLLQGCGARQLTLVHKQPDGRRWITTYPPEDRSRGVVWKPMEGDGDYGC